MTILAVALSCGGDDASPLVEPDQRRPPPPLAGGAPDPTLLPAATGQAPDFGSYEGRSLRAGDWYADPTTGVTVFKVTDSGTPVGNERAVPDYAEGGPHISLPWGPDRDNYTLHLLVRPNTSTHYFVDFNLGSGTFSNWRLAPTGTEGELLWAFSNDPASPRIGYYYAGGTLRRYDSGAMSEAPAGNFPKSLGLERGVWLHQDSRDEWFTVMAFSGSEIVAWNSQTDVVHSFSGDGVDEPHLDRSGNYLYMRVDQHDPIYDAEITDIMLMDLSDGSVTDPRVPHSHPAQVLDYLVAINPHEGPAETFYYDPANDTYNPVLIGDELTRSSGHKAGQWVLGNDPGPQQWYLHSGYGDGGGNPKANEAIVFVRVDGSDVRLLAHHFSADVDDYYEQPHASISPDGKLVLWGSNMGSPGGRPDAFLAVVPGG